MAIGILEPIQVGGILLTPSPHLQARAKDSRVSFKVDDDGYPEIWLGNCLWEVSGASHLPDGTVFDTGAPRPVARLMTLEDQAYIVAWLNQAAASSKH